MSVVFFESDRLWYRPPERMDAERMQRWVNDPEVRRNLLRRLPISLGAELAWVDGVSLPVGTSAPDKLPLLFGLKGEADPIGSAGLFAFDWITRAAEWGLIIGEPDNWNKGYGREVARAFLRYGFAELNLNRIMLRVNATNTGGIKAYEAAGFVREGALRQAAFIEGAHQDVLIMSVLRVDWTES